jgi:putative ABC transport system permease protein
MVLQRKLWRTIKEQRWRYLGAFLLILFSSMLYVSFNVAGPSVEQGLERFKSTHHVEDAQFMTLQPYDEAQRASLEAELGVTIEPRFSLDLAYDTKSTVRVLRETASINQAEIIEGRGLEASGEIVVDPLFARAHGLQLGDTMVLKDSSYTVTGFFTVADYIYVLKSTGDMLNQPATFGIAMISAADFASFPDYSPLYAARFQEDTGDQLKQMLNERYTLTHWLDREDNSRIQFVNGDVQAFQQIGTLMPISVLIVTCGLIAIVIWRLLKSELVQIGTFYALGYRKRTLLLHYLQLPFWVAALGGLIGTLIGYAAANSLMVSFSIQYNLPSFEMQLAPIHLLIGVLLPVAFLVPAAWFVVHRSLRLSPLQLMRGEGTAGGKAGFFESRISLRRFSFDQRFRLRELLRNVPRSIVMTVGVLFSSMMLLLGFVTIDSMNSLIEDQFEEVYQFEYQYTYREPVDFAVTDGERVSLAPYTLADVTAGDSAIMLYGIEPQASLLQLKDREGGQLDFTQVTATRQLADLANLTVGDTLAITSRLSGESVSLKIEAIAESFNGPNLYMPLEEFNTLQGWPAGSFMQLMTMEPITSPIPPASVEQKQDLIDGYASMISMIYGFIGAIAVIAALIAIILISIITSMIIEENRGTISLMKVLGYPKKKVRALILNSNSVLVILGYLLAVPLILFSMDAMFSQFTQEMNLVIPAKVSWWNVLIGFAVIWIAYDLSRRLSRRAIENISMAESLKSRAE